MRRRAKWIPDIASFESEEKSLDSKGRCSLSFTRADSPFFRRIGKNCKRSKEFDMKSWFDRFCISFSLVQIIPCFKEAGVERRAQIYVHEQEPRGCQTSSSSLFLLPFLNPQKKMIIVIFENKMGWAERHFLMGPWYALSRKRKK